MTQTHLNYYLDTLNLTRWQLRQPREDNRVDWNTLKQQVSECRACALCEGRKQTVFGVGNTNADLLIVGEAPGYHEDQQGEPFVGRAGQLLNAILAASGLQREQVYITNILKCRPPQNRDPQIEEVLKCTPFLEQQVSLLQPKVIVAVGRHAAHYLLECNQSLGRLRTTVHQFRQTKIPLFVSYHPAYLLRNPSDKSKAYQDWLKIKNAVN